MNNFEPLKKPWLEEFHINKYVKKFDGRSYNQGGGGTMGNTRLLNRKRLEIQENMRQKKLDRLIKTYEFNV